MRLIDADKLLKQLEWLDIDDFILYEEVKEDIDESPTVEAIPIEWLKRWFETQVWRGSSPTDRIHCKASDIIEDWEKENEAD